MYSGPVIKDIDTTPRLVATNGSLNWPSVYRQPPGPEVDEAWNEISYNSKSHILRTFYRHDADSVSGRIRSSGSNRSQSRTAER